MIDLETIGRRIRRLRLASEMRQEDLAERANLTAGFISQVERGKTSISIDSLMMILDALNIHISEFFRPTEERLVFRKADGIPLDREGVHRFITLVPGSANREMEPVLVTLLPGEQASLDPFSGEQFGYLIKGKLTLTYGDREEKMDTGDSFFTEGLHEIRLRNGGKGETEFIWITSPPWF